MAQKKKAATSATAQAPLLPGHDSAVALHWMRGEARVDSRVIAARLGIEHQSVRELIQDYAEDFEVLGVLRFETGEIKGRGQPERFVLLSEDQCYLLLTYCRNTERVRALKLRLVIAFRDARSRQALHDGVYLPSYHALHDEVAEMARRAHEAGSMADECVFHVNVNKLANKVCGLAAGQRDRLTPTQRTVLTATQEVIRASLHRSMAVGDDHRAAYKAAKAAATTYATMAGQLLGGVA